MPVFPEDRFVDAIVQTVQANAAYVPPYGSGASLYIRPYMFGINPVIGVKPADEYQFRVFTTPVGPYLKVVQNRLRSVYLILTGQLLTERGILRRGLIMQ